MSSRKDSREQEEGRMPDPSEEISADELDAVAGGAGLPGSLSNISSTSSTMPAGAIVTPYPNGWAPSLDTGLANTPTGLPPMVPEGGAPLGY